MPCDSLRRLDAALRAMAALLGTLPVAVLASLCLARWLPLDANTRLAVGSSIAMPLWVTAIAWASLARRAWRAWALCLGLGALFAALTYGL